MKLSSLLTYKSSIRFPSMLIQTLFSIIGKSFEAFICNKQIPTLDIEPIAMKAGLSDGFYPLL